MAAEPHQTGNDRLGVVRRILPRPLALLALAIAGYLGWQSYVAMFGLEARTERTRSLLSSVTLELIEFREATQSEAVEQLRLALAEAGADERKVRVLVMTPEEAVRDAQEPTSVEAVQWDRGQRQSLVLKNATGLEAAMYVAALFDGKAWCEGSELRIYPWKTELEPLLSKTYEFPPQWDRLQSEVKRADGCFDVRDNLTQWGVSFREGARADYWPETGKLKVLLPQTDIDLIETSSICRLPSPSWWGRIRNWVGL